MTLGSTIQLGELMAERTGSLDPSKYPDEEFELYSIPSFDQQKPEVLVGRSIGSAKQLVEPGDVLLSKIVPHIRRSWVVGPRNGRRLIASGEWIVFRSNRVLPEYLRHFLVSDAFHTPYMSTVSGVGGSLLRARPEYVGRIHVPLPPIQQQRHVADVLNRADALRSARRSALATLELLVQSLFLALFDAPDSSDWPRVPLPNAYWFQEGPGVRKWQFRDQGVKLLNVGNIEKGGSLNLTKTERYLDEAEAYGKYKHFLVDPGDLVIASSGISFDADGMLRTRGAFVSEMHLPLCMNTSTVRFKPLDGVSDLRFLWAWLNSREFRSQITRAVTGSAQQNFGPSHLASTMITLPPFSIQARFGEQVDRLERLRTSQISSLQEMNALCSSLERRAFSGEVVR